MDISVIIVNYRTPELTMGAIESIRSNTRRCTYSVTVIDNDSGDGSAERISEKFPWVNMLRNAENVGFARACNQGIAATESKYVLLLNSDAILINEAIDHTFEYMENVGQLAALTCRIENEDGSPQHVCQRFPRLKYRLMELLRLQKLMRPAASGRLMLGPWFNYSVKVEPDWIWGTFFMLRRSALDQMEGAGLDDTYFMYGEDRQWCWQFRAAGWDIGFDPAGRVRHRSNASGGFTRERLDEAYRDFIARNLSPTEGVLVKLIDRLL